MKDPARVPKALHAYIIPSEDAHQSEYTAACDDRRSFLSGFDGSAGTAVVTGDKAAMWTDGRYFLQAEQQMEDCWTLMKAGQNDTPTESAWLISEFRTLPPPGGVVGADPTLMDWKRWAELEKSLGQEGHELVAVTCNLVDEVWGEARPPRPHNPVKEHALEWTGRSITDKLEDTRQKLRDKHCTALVLTALDDIAYLLNLRGSDIAYNPVFFSYVVLSLDSATLFIDGRSVDIDTQRYLEAAGVEVRPYEEFLGALASFSTPCVWLPSLSPASVHRACSSGKHVVCCSPVQLMKAVKNPVEAAGMRLCHSRDGAAVCSFLAWLETEAKGGKQTEISAADYLEQCRSQQPEFLGLSFPSISSVGSNAAIIHYGPTPETDRAVDDQQVYLCDSGGHYRNGTTDVTRTVHFGTPSPEIKEMFTRVLKGHIALGSAVFPEGLKGLRLDTLARTALWNVGLNYAHGTGHGIGAYLNVHEGPMGISWRDYADDPGLCPGMFLSNEPGYYKNGHYGIRIESIVEIVRADTKYGEEKFCAFRDVTLVPIQAKLIELSLLTAQELAWLNAYHERVRGEVGPLLKGKDQRGYDWLMRETEKL